MDRAREIGRHVLHYGVHPRFAIAHSHYENIDLEIMSQGFAPGHTDAHLDEIKKVVAPLA